MEQASRNRDFKTQVTEEEAKANHGAIVLIKVEKDEKQYIAYLKKPSREAIGVAMVQMRSSITQGCETIFMDAVIREISPNYQDIFEDDDLFVSACTAIQASVSLKKNSSKIL